MAGPLPPIDRTGADDGRELRAKAPAAGVRMETGGTR